MCPLNDNHMIMVPEICSVTDIMFCQQPFFALLPPNDSENQNFEKMKKK